LLIGTCTHISVIAKHVPAKIIDNLEKIALEHFSPTVIFTNDSNINEIPIEISGKANVKCESDLKLDNIC
jgi:hypothetical protein